jgi:dipeptidyl aminopeptidase/acylaminoacyl peptidase
MTKRAIQIDDLFRLKLVGDAQVSPDGKKIAYVVKEIDRDEDEYRSNIWFWECGQSRQYTSGNKDSAPRWSPDGRWLAFLSGRDKEKKSQIYLLPTSGGEPRPLTEQKLGAGVPVWSPDSRRIAFAGPVPIEEEDDDEENKEGPPTARVIERAVYKNDGQGFTSDRRSHVIVVDLPEGAESATVTQITHGDFHHQAPAWSPEGTHIAFAADRDPEWDLRAMADIWIVPAEGGEPRRITDLPGQWHNPVFSPDGSHIACSGYAKLEDGESTYYPQLWTFSRAGGDGVNLLEGTDLAVGNSVSSDWSAAGEDAIAWEPDGIYFAVSERGTCNVYRSANGVPAPVTEGRRHVMDFSVSGGTLAFTAADAVQPADVWRLEAGEAAQSGEAVTAHNAELLEEICVAAPQHLTFTGTEDAAIDGWLLKPAGWTEGRRFPLIVYIHGGPVFAYGETFFHEFQTLAGAGFGVFYCNPHGSSSYGQRFQVSIMGDWGNLDYGDVMAGADRVCEEPWVDAHRLGVAGGSYGGFMVNWITSHTDRFAAACTQRSICNMVSQGGTSDWAATRGERLLATPEGDPERLWNMSPLKYVSQVKTPTLILHSERDDRCPIEEGEQWFLALKRLRVPVRFVRFPEESHGLSRGGKPSRRVERLEQILSWFRTYL